MEERTISESWTIPWACFGGMTALKLNALVLEGSGNSDTDECLSDNEEMGSDGSAGGGDGSDSSLDISFRYTAAVIGAVVILISYLSLPSMKQARKLSDRTKVGSMQKFYQEVLKKKSVRVLILYRMIRSYISTTIAQMGTYYLAYVSSASQVETAFYMFRIPLYGIIVQIGFSIFWGWYVSR